MFMVSYSIQLAWIESKRVGWISNGDVSFYWLFLSNENSNGGSFEPKRVSQTVFKVSGVGRLDFNRLADEQGKGWRFGGHLGYKHGFDRAPLFDG